MASMEKKTNASTSRSPVRALGTCRNITGRIVRGIDGGAKRADDSPSKPRRMHPSTILTVDYHDPPATPWPRLLRFIAILSMLYGAAYLANSAMTVRSIFNLRKLPRLYIN